jgi:hypothetical protein
MLKTRDYELSGKDGGLPIRLLELPALCADRAARRILADIDEDIDGGVVSLAYQHLRAARALGENTSIALMEFVRGDVLDVAGGKPIYTLDVKRHVRDWRNVERLQNMALLLHVDFMVGRKQMELPVRMQAASILADTGARVTYCSPALSGVINSKYASYVELETVLGTEDVFNLAESINADSLREWMNSQTAHARSKL